MKKEDLTAYTLPDQPGVYLFEAPNGEILYVGKATSLRDRVRSYFSKDLMETRGPLVVQAVADAAKVDWRTTDSVLEALILEAALIKQWKPKANTDGKDDKSDWFVVITKEDFPRVLMVRGNELYQRFLESDLKKIFGPFPHAGELKEALKIIRKIFPYFDTAKPINEARGRMEEGKIKFNQEIGRYPGKHGLSKEVYGRTIRHLVLFFEGKKGALLKLLEKEMKIAAKAERFEEAAVIRGRIFALQHIKDVSLIKSRVAHHLGTQSLRIEAYDVAHTGGSGMVGVMVVVEDGVTKKSDYRKFKIKTVKSKSDDTGALKEILERRFSHNEWVYPRIIAVDGGKAQVNTAEAVLASLGLSIPVVGVVKDEHHRPRSFLGPAELHTKYAADLLLANSEAHRFAVAYHDTKRRLR